MICITTAAASSTEKTIRIAVGSIYGLLAFSEEISLINEITAILNDPSFTVVDGSYENQASPAASKICDRLWYSYPNNSSTESAGQIAAWATSDLFYALGRETELGWIVSQCPSYYRFRGISR